MVKVSDLIAEFLKVKKIDTVFGIIGSANSHIFDSISKLGYTKIINTHHEQAAVLAMGAHYRASGKLSAAIVTAGGGATNAVTGVVSNWADSIPGIIISGQENYNYVSTQENLRMYGTQGLNITKMVKEVTKLAVAFDDTDDIQTILEELDHTTTIGRPGPVWLDVPMNLQAKMVNKKDWNFIKPIKIETNVEFIIDEINKSKRPVIVGGNGIRLSGAKKQFNQFLNYAKIPTLLTWSGIDLLDNNNENYFGRFGLYGQRAANFIVQNADLVIVLGSRLALPQVGYDFSQFARDAKIIVVDIDELEGTKYPVDYIWGNCKEVIENLIQSSHMVWGYKEEWVNQCKELKEKYPLVDETIHKDNGYLNSYKFITKMSDYLKDDHIIVTDMGTALLSGHQNIKLQPNQTMFTSQGLGEMGYGLPGALGAALACPDRPVLCMNCDGGIMMNLQELHTIIENKLNNIKIIIFNNDGYLMIKHTQKMLFKGDYVSVDKKTGIGLPNFSRLLPAFGYDYYELKEWNNLDSTMNNFLNNPKSAVLEVFMDPEQDFIPKVKGVVREDGSIFPPPIEEMSPLLPFEIIKKEMIIDISEKSKQIKR
jgi:acetolactate synthase-1/2/3 large subunit